jgi:anti-sigma factor ChrR (cupin superfamily)
MINNELPGSSLRTKESNMEINADFNKRVVVHSEQLDWLDSPMPGVSRRPLDRVGGEVARATTIVRYQADSHFSPHTHTGGEEFIVISGVFQDEHGDYPAGSYLRNPPQTRHTPGAKDGCVIFVKLWQFEPDDNHSLRANINELERSKSVYGTGVTASELYRDSTETVQVLHCEPNSHFTIPATNGIELLLLEGELQEGDDHLTQHSWLRAPVDMSVNAKAGNQGATLWIKTGHLARVEQEIARVNASA